MNKYNNLLLNNENIETLEQLQKNLTPALFEAFRSGDLTEWLRLHKLTEQEKVVAALFVENLKREAQLLNTLYQLFKTEEKVEPEIKSSNLSSKVEDSKKVEDSTSDVYKELTLQFIARDDGTAIDSSTGLLWCRYLIGQEWIKRRAYGVPKEISFNDVLKAIEKFNSAKLGGFNDWRLPHPDELKRIMNSKTIIGNNNSLLGLNEHILFERARENLWMTTFDSSVIGNSTIAMVNYYGGKNARSGISLKYARLVRGRYDQNNYQFF